MQTDTAVAQPITHDLHTFRYTQGTEHHAAGKDALTQLLHAIRQMTPRQTRAIGKRTVSNPCQSLCTIHFFQIAAPQKRLYTNAFDALAARN